MSDSVGFLYLWELGSRRVEYPVNELLRIEEVKNFHNFDAYENTMLNATRG